MVVLGVPSKEGSGQIPLLNRINDFLHLPVIDELAWYLFWVLLLSYAPSFIPVLLLVLVVDFVSGRVVPIIEEPKGRSILVTGCDTGFGHDLALTLVKKGWKVYAGCLTKEGMTNLQSKAGSDLMVPVALDVTKMEDIQEVVAKVEKECPEGLYALVNNAGLYKAGLIDWTPIEDYRKVFDVNFFAMVNLTKACLPLLKKSKGRVVNMSSITGIFMGVPLMSAYSASKHACDAFTTALRLELKGWGIRVVTVNPSWHKTPMATHASSSLSGAYDKLPNDVKSQYGPNYLTTCEGVLKSMTDSSWDPDVVTRVMVTATTCRNPRVQYVVGSDAKFRLFPMMNLPTGLLEFGVEKRYLREMIPAVMKR